MIIINNCVLIGRLTKDPELKYLPSGNNTAVAKFTLAVDRQLSKEKRVEMESRNQPTADFINITVWGKQAENVVNYTSKGRLVAVEGRIQTGSYEAKDGTRRYTTEVVANRVQFLEWDDNNSNQYGQQESIGGVDGFYQVNNDDIPF